MRRGGKTESGLVRIEGRKEEDKRKKGKKEADLFIVQVCHFRKSYLYSNSGQISPRDRV